MSPATVTLIDVARAAQVSRTTASAALGGSGRISDETRERVRAVAEELGYVANPAARHLQGGRKGAIGLYVPDNLTGYSFYMELAFGAAEAARREGFAVTLVAPPPAPGPARAAVVAHVDGFVVVDPQVGDPFVPELIGSPAPVLSAERVLEGPEPDVTVETEHGEAIRALLDHLAERGARAPALLNLELEFSWTRLVEDVYRRWCEEHDVPASVIAIPATSDPAVIRDLTRALLLGPSPPDAIVSAPDGTALGVLGAARDVGRLVGRDLLVASCVDSLAMQLATPPLTAIALQPRAIGRDAAEILIGLIRGKETPAVVRRERPPLVLRASTGMTDAPDPQGEPASSGVS